MINCTQQLQNTEMTPIFFTLILIIYPFLIPINCFILIKKRNKMRMRRLFFNEIIKLMSFRNLIDYGNFYRVNCDIESSCRFSVPYFIGECSFIFYFYLYPAFVNNWNKFTVNERLVIILAPFFIGIYLVTVISYNCYPSM